MTTVGAWIRILFNYSLVLSFIGSTIASFSNPLYVGAPSKLSSVIPPLISENECHHSGCLCQHDRRGYRSAYSRLDRKGQILIPSFSDHHPHDSGSNLSFCHSNPRSHSLQKPPHPSSLSGCSSGEVIFLQIHEIAPH